jgi:hypothetical protein
MLRSNLTHDQAREWEKEYIAKFGRKDNHTGRQMLLNRTDGGDGVAGSVRPASAIASQRAAMLGRPISAEHKAKLSAANKGKARSMEARAKQGESNKGRPRSAEAKAKISETMRGKTQSADIRAKQSETKIRNTAIRNGVDPLIWGRMSRGQRNNAQSYSKKQGVTVAQYIEKMKSKWGL